MDPPDSVKRLRHASAPTKQLAQLNICQRCLLRIAGEHSPAIIRDAKSTFDKFPLYAIAVSNGNHQEQSGDPTAALQASSCELSYSDCSTISSVLSSENDFVCPCCIGLLEELFCGAEFLMRIYEFVIKNGYSMQMFWCSLTTPNAMEIRQRAFDEFWERSVSEETSLSIKNRLSVKDAWKAVVTPVLSRLFNSRWVGHDGLEINLLLEQADIEEECEPLKMKYPTAFQEKRGPDGKMKRLITRQALEKLLHKLHSDDFRELIAFPPKPLLSPVRLTQISCLPCSTFIAGRYLKFSRCLSQTPWFLEEDDRKGDTSVEELICAQIQERFKCQSYRFLSSGREDFDVRMLGSGRPFAVELIGAKVAVISIWDMMTLQDSINSANKDIEVHQLQLVSRESISIIKSGEEEKTKTYSALCESSTAITDSDLSRLNSLNNLLIKQRTPVRVLHRRSNAERQRMIHEIAAEKVENNPNQFRLKLKTQAGTYIKEFIHSDFGRTLPSVSSLLDRHVECEELDVTCVDLEWPPMRLD